MSSEADLQTPRDLYQYLQKSSENVTIMWIEEEQISTMDEMLPPSVRPVTGDLSCFCQYPGMCRDPLMRCQLTRQVMSKYEFPLNYLHFTMINKYMILFL